MCERPSFAARDAALRPAGPEPTMAILNVCDKVPTPNAPTKINRKTNRLT